MGLEVAAGPAAREGGRRRDGAGPGARAGRGGCRYDSPRPSGLQRPACLAGRVELGGLRH